MPKHRDGDVLIPEWWLSKFQIKPKQQEEDADELQLPLKEFRLVVEVVVARNQMAVPL